MRLISLRHPTDTRRHPIHHEIQAPVAYLPEYLHHEPGRVLGAWMRVRGRPGYAQARRIWLKDLKRDPTPNRIRRFGQALVLAAELPADVTWIYAHFLHTPCSVARYAAVIRGLPWSVSAHAKDIWTLPEWEKVEKLADCRWLVTCTRYNAEHLRGLTPDPERVGLVYHGLDLDRFPPAPDPRPPRDGRDPDDPVIILSVGRAVEKKGYPVLLQALRRLPAHLHWRFVHIGGGALHDALREEATAAGLGDRVSWLGAQSQETVLAQYRAADLFALACRVAGDGDRDGLPNVLMEAQSQGLPCVSTHVSAIPELIADGETGLLVAPDDPQALAVALERLIVDPALRAELGAAGEARVRRDFGFEIGIAALAERFPCASPSTHP